MRGLLVLICFGCLVACQPSAEVRAGGTVEQGLGGQAESTQKAGGQTDRDKDSDVAGASAGQSLETIERPVTTCIPLYGIHSWSWWKTFLRWSPEGREIFVTRGPVLFAASADGVSVRTITRGPVDHLDVMSTMIPFDITPDGRHALIAVCTYPRPAVGRQDQLDGFGRPLGREVDGLYGTYGYELAQVDLGSGHPPALSGIDADSELASHAADARAPRRLTANPVFDGYPAWAPDGRRVAFLQGLIAGSEYYDGARRLVTLAPDGGDPRVLVTHDGNEVETGLAMQPPVWSPDGRRLAFAAAAGRTLVGLYTVPTDGAAPRRLNFLRALAATMSAPAWSPDGRRLAFASVEDDVLALFTIAVDGSDRRRVADVRAWEPSSRRGWETWGPRRFGTITDVAWSPDGTKLLFTYGTAVCVVTLDGVLMGQATFPSDDPYSTCLAPDQPQKVGDWTGDYKYEAVATWSPSGERIAFVFALADSFHYEDSRDVELRLYTMAPDGSDVRPVAGSGFENRLVPGSSGTEDAAVSRAACAAGIVVAEPAAQPGLVRDCEALVDMREALLGKRRSLANWVSGTPIDQWHGVTVTGTPPRVTAINLSRHSLRGTLPPRLGDLTHLQTLDIARNAFAGQIPREVGRLVALRHVNLSRNLLTGPIPRELGRLTNLTYLDLSQNKLTGAIPAELGLLDGLRDVRLAGNHLTGCVPVGLWVVDRRELGLPDCGAAAMPGRVARWSGLTRDRSAPNWAQPWTPWAGRPMTFT